MKYCSRCGASNDTDAKFCVACGSEFAQACTEDVTQSINEEQQAEALQSEAAAAEQPEQIAAEDWQEQPEQTVAEDQPEQPEQTAAEDWQEQPEQTVAEDQQGQPEQTAAEDRQGQAEQPVEAACEPTNVYEPKNKKGKGIAFGVIGFICAIHAFCGCFFPITNILSLINGILGIVFCSVSRKNTSFRLANVGKVFGIIALIASVLTIIIYVILMIVGYMAVAAEAGISMDLEEAVRFFFARLSALFDQ